MTADAGRCYEKAGDTKSATRCRAKQAEQVGQPLQAAQYYEQATMYKDAGRCYYQASRYADAGRCYEQARNYRKAAECYKLAGMYAEAARCEAMAAPPTPPPGSSGCVLVLLWQLHQPLLPALQGACWCCYGSSTNPSSRLFRVRAGVAMAAPPTPPPGSSGCVLVLLWQLHQPLLPALQGACWCC